MNELDMMVLRGIVIGPEDRSVIRRVTGIRSIGMMHRYLRSFHEMDKLAYHNVRYAFEKLQREEYFSRQPQTREIYINKENEMRIIKMCELILADPILGEHAIAILKCMAKDRHHYRIELHVHGDQS